MNGALGHYAALYGSPKPSTTWLNEINFVMNQAPLFVGSIAQPDELALCAKTASTSRTSINNY